MYFDGKSSNLSQCQINMSIAKCLKINVVSRVFFEVKITRVFKRFTIINEQNSRELPVIFSFKISNRETLLSNRTKFL